ncbi:MAG: ABC transporter permease, partial [Bacillota bacterium]
MWAFILRRTLIMIPMMLLASVICFIIIELQPGDFVSQYLDNPRISPDQIRLLRERLALDRPAYVRYFNWLKGILLRGDFGYSFAYERPVGDLIFERMGWTVGIALLTIVFQWILAIPMGIYSALKPYSKGDYALTIGGFIGISIPDFFFALILMYFMLKMGATSIGGLFSTQFIGAPWSFAKFLDLLKHIWMPL